MGVSIHPVSDLASLLSLEQVKPDAYLGAGPVLGWGRIYGGQVVAQALRAAGLTVDEHLRPQSLHAYFVQAGDERLPGALRGRARPRQRLVRDPSGGRVSGARRGAQSHRELPPSRGVDRHRGDLRADATCRRPRRCRRSRPIFTSSGASVLRRDRSRAVRARLDARPRGARRRPDAPGVRVRRTAPTSSRSAPRSACTRPCPTGSGCSRPASTTRSGSTARCAPTTGCCTSCAGGGVADGRGLAFARVFDRRRRARGVGGAGGTGPRPALMARSPYCASAACKKCGICH